MNFISRIANTAAYTFLVLTFILSAVCVVGIWGSFDDVISKTFASLFLIALAFFVILAIDGSGHFKKSVPLEAVAEYTRVLENFIAIRKMSFFVVIVSVVVSVLLGLLSIWEILEGEVLYKTLATIATIGFYALITVAVCKQRETSIKSVTVESPGSPASGGVIGS
jgi:hypothetical protein